MVNQPMQISLEAYYNALKPTVAGEELLGDWSSAPSGKCCSRVNALSVGVPQAARLRKRVNCGSNSNFTVPTGPLRCLVTITSVMPRSGVSGL